MGEGGDGRKERVLVLGCGPIGIVVVAVAVALGVREVVVTDFTDSRIQYMKKQFPEAKISGLNIRVCFFVFLFVCLFVCFYLFLFLYLDYISCPHFIF